MKKLPVLFLLPLIIIIFLIYSGLKAPSLVTLKEDTISSAVYATGIVEAVTQTKLSSQSSGNLNKLYFIEGQTFNKGDILADIDNKVEQEKLREIEANLKFLKLELNRDTALRKENIIDQSKLDMSLSKYKEAEAQYNSQKEVISRKKLVAPFSGTILRKYVEEGEFVNQGTPILTIGDPKNIWITADIDEDDITKVSLKQETLITADAFKGHVFKGYVKEITPLADSLNKTYRVRIGIDDIKDLLLGMTVELNIVVDRSKKIHTLPLSAVKKSHVMLYQNRKLVKTPVVTGAKNKEEIEIISGISETDQVLENYKED